MENIFDINGVFVNTERLVLSDINESEHDEYIKLLNDESRKVVAAMDNINRDAEKELNACYNDNEAYFIRLSEHKESTVVTMTIRENGAFCGYCQLRGTDKKLPEIFVDIAEENRGKGIGFETAKAVIEKARGIFNAEGFKALIDVHNAPAVKIAEKLNAEKNEDIVREKYGEMYDQSKALRAMILEKYGDDENNPMLPLLTQLATLPEGYIIK